jgi:hypothetical protein
MSHCFWPTIYISFYRGILSNSPQPQGVSDYPLRQTQRELSNKQTCSSSTQTPPMASHYLQDKTLVVRLGLFLHLVPKPCTVVFLELSFQPLSPQALFCPSLYFPRPCPSPSLCSGSPC